MRVRQLITAVTIVCSGALLFLIQPILAKSLLPRFGGSAGVWVACMMFFQIVLLLGYGYAYAITRYAGATARTTVHLALLAASLLLLPLHAAGGSGAGHPTVAILLLLGSSAGLPFFLLSSTSPLLQAWSAGRRGTPLPYWLFALSNAACLVALLAYPLAVEPALAAPTQLRWWSAGYLAVALLLMLAAVQNRTWVLQEKPDAADADEAPARPLRWILPAACASALWLAAANHLSQEVAPIPFLWVLPMTVYLLTFVLCFSGDGWYRPAVFRWLLPAAWIGLGSRLGLGGAAGDLRVDLPVTLAALFVLCLFCHGELARSKPATRQGLPFFYLMAAAGGALGGVFVGVVAPTVFSSYLELPIGIVASILLALPLAYGVTSRGHMIRLGVLSAAAFAAASSLHTGRVAGGRNFYGVLEVRDRGEGEMAVRTLYNGRTIHGVEYLAPDRRRIPVAYYGPDSGIGRLFGALPAAERRVAIVGLGAGSLAAYGRKGDRFRFYEINPAVVEAAAQQFHYLSDSAAATDVVTGDGRLRLAEEPPESLDAIVLDAFSDDAIPVHLLTREAFQLYFARLRGGGPVVIHITNRYLDLAPVIESLAQALHKSALVIHSRGYPEVETLTADWAIVGDSGALPASLRRYAAPSGSRPGPLWTDEYSNLFQIWR